MVFMNGVLSALTCRPQCPRSSPAKNLLITL